MNPGKFAMLAVVLASGAALATPARADSNFSVGISVREEYNDNIALVNTKRVDDFVTSLGPYLQAAREWSRVKCDLAYRPTFVIYANNPERDLGLQDVKAESLFTIVDQKLLLDVQDQYTRIPVDPRKQQALDNLFVNMTDTNKLMVNPRLTLPLGSTMSTSLAYTYQNIWYKDAAGDNAQKHTALASISKTFTPSLSGFVSYSYLWHRPERTDAYDNQVWSVGANWDVTTKLTLSGSFGKTLFEYQNPARSDLNSNVWQAQASYRLGERISLVGGYSESYVDSVNVGTAKNDSATASISYTGKATLKLTGHLSDATYIGLVREDHSKGANLEAGIPLSELVGLRLTGYYEHYKFLPEGELGDRYGAKLGFDWQLRITKLSVGYTFNRNQSTHAQQNYVNNIVSAQALFIY